LYIFYIENFIEILRKFALKFSILMYVLQFTQYCKIHKANEHVLFFFFFLENTKSSGKGEYSDGVDQSAKRVGRIHDDEGTQFGGGTRRSGS